MPRVTAHLVFIAAWALGESLISAQPAALDNDLSPTVAYLIDFVANSDVTFIRNGKAHTSREAAKHMRDKYGHFKKEVKTPEDFIRLAASKSEISGQPYLVRTKDGKEIKAAEWLGKALNEYRQQNVSNQR
ncbi:MAG TPA: DUF5329 family protein [Candidatus Binatia bacterium]